MRETLREVALRAAEAAVHGQEPPSARSAIALQAAVFVSVYVGEELRGCIGTLDAESDLLHAVARLAGEAATQDTRFRPVEEGELGSLGVKLSVLSDPVAVTDRAEIVVGTHGVIVRESGRVGVLLPRVGATAGWDPDTLVLRAAMKADIEAEALESAVVERFETEDF